MGLPQNPQDAAPAYDDVFHDHPVNQFRSSGSASAYAAVPQNDDVELHAHSHTSASPAPISVSEPESLVQTIAGVFKPKAHVHCEQCDVETAARQQKSNERHCCNMVAATFMTLFVCVMLLGIVVVGNVYSNKKKHGHG